MRPLLAFFREKHSINQKARDFLRYLGPGLLVTIGFIDPGNWASNLAAGAGYGYTLLWMVTLSTVMLIILQHNAAHLGIVTGLCLSEAAAYFIRPIIAKTILLSAVAAAAATAMAEVLGGAIALNMLFHIPIKIAAILTAIFCGWLLWSNSYRKLEKVLIGFVSLIGISFLFEISLVNIAWPEAVVGWIVPKIPDGSLLVVMSVLGAVVMPHNLFLHSEIIQSRQWHIEDAAVIQKQLKYEFVDTLLSMGLGWAINSAMILVAAAVFFTNNIAIEELQQAEIMLRPLLGSNSALVFSVALLFSGIASTVTAGMAGGSIFAGIFKEPYDIKDRHSWLGVIITYGSALLSLFFIDDPFKGLIYSQMVLSLQLPWTIFLQIYLTSSVKVMGIYANNLYEKLLLWIVAGVVTMLNVMLLLDFLKS